MYENLGYQKGKMLENETLGEPKKESREKYENYISSLDQTAKFMDVVKVIEVSQSNESSSPKRYFAKKLRETIAEKLKIDIKNEPYLIEFYNSIGTILDYKFGTDAFVSIKEPMTKFNARITIDLTTNPSKDSHKADVISYFPEGSLDETDEKERQKFDQIINQTADEICSHLNRLKDQYFGQRNQPNLRNVA